MNKPNFIVPALIGGAFLGILSPLPLLNLVNCACCALVIGGGLLASFLFLREVPPGAPNPTYGDGAFLGLLTGVFGGLIWTAVELPLAFFKLQFLPASELAEIEELLNNPDIPPAIQDFLAALLNPEGLSLAMIMFSTVANMVLAVIFATLGAILGIALFRKPQASPFQTMMPPPPPV